MTGSSPTAGSVEAFPAGKNLRVLGPSGSGKTRSLIERYRSLTAREANSALVLTYSGASMRRLTERLFSTDDAKTGTSPVMTFFSLSREVIAASGARPPTVVDDVRENLVLEGVIEANASRFRSDYRRIRSSEGLRRELLQIFHYLMQSGLSESDDRRTLSSASDDPAVGDVFMLYDGFAAALAEKDLATFYDIAWRAARIARERHGPLESVRTLLVDDFQDVDAGQFELLKAIAPPDGERSVSAFGDPMGSFFGFRGTDVRFLLEDFPKVWGGETVYLQSPDAGSPALERALEAIIGETLGENAGRYARAGRPGAHASNAGQLSLFDAPGPADDPASRKFDITITDDEVAEAYSIAARVDGQLRAGRLPAEVAIVSNRKAEYEPLLAMAFHQWGIPLDAGRSGGDAFREFAYATLSMFAGRRDDVIEKRLLTSPFFETFRDACLETRLDPARDFARAARALAAWADSFQTSLASVRGEDHLPHVMRQVLSPVSRRYVEHSGDESAHCFAAQLERSWRDFIEAIDATGSKGRANLATFLRTTDLFERRTGDPSSTQHVRFYSCRELKGLYFPVTFVLGCSELLFPSARGPSGMLPLAAIQEVLAEKFPQRCGHIHGARTSDEMLREEYHLLYSSLCRGTEAVHVSAPKQFGGREHPSPSAILENAGPPIHHDAAEAMPPVVRFARGWIASAGDAKIAAGLSDLNRIGPAWPLAPPQRELFSLAPFDLSKTSIDTYVKCPRLFFYRRILRVPEDDSINLKLGLIFHEVMRVLGKKFPTRVALHAGATDDVIEETIAAVLDAEPRIERGTFVTDALEYHVASMVRSLLSLDRQESDVYDVVAIEEKLNFESGGWGFNGKIDRVEKTPAGELIITDYKTGEFNKTGETLRKRVLATLGDDDKKDWQVPIYLFGYQDDDGNRATAFKHYVVQPGEDPFHIKLFVGASEDALPPEAAGGKGRYKRYSYVLSSELDDVMTAVVDVAGRIFDEREGFPKTDNLLQCRNCFFNRLCGREG